MRRIQGFTLIEVMIVVVVLAILAAVAYPSYQSYIARSHRSDAQQFMMQMHNRQQQLLLEQRAYATAPNALNVASTGWACTATTCSNQWYTIDFNPAVDNTATPPSYTIRARPIAACDAHAKDSATITLTSTGVRARTVYVNTSNCSGGTTSKSWETN
jgi:type IV pilus assembly protein PilE